MLLGHPMSPYMCARRGWKSTPSAPHDDGWPAPPLVTFLRYGRNFPDEIALLLIRNEAPPEQRPIRPESSDGGGHPAGITAPGCRALPDFLISFPVMAPVFPCYAAENSLLTVSREFAF